jgi:hypothetical protein
MQEQVRPSPPIPPWRERNRFAYREGRRADPLGCVCGIIVAVDANRGKVVAEFVFSGRPDRVERLTLPRLGAEAGPRPCATLPRGDSARVKFRVSLTARPTAGHLGRPASSSRPGRRAWRQASLGRGSRCLSVLISPAAAAIGAGAPHGTSAFAVAESGILPFDDSISSVARQPDLNGADRDSAKRQPLAEAQRKLSPLQATDGRRIPAAAPIGVVTLR